MAYMSKTEEKLFHTDESKIICFDLETTGKHPHSDEILQIAIINGYGQVLLNEYVKPKRKKKWPDAEAVNNISPADVQDCQPFTYYKESIQEIFDNADYVIGYNSDDFDIPFIKAEGIKVSCKSYDVMSAAKKYIKKTTGKSKFVRGYFKLSNLACYNFDYPGFNAHDALEDCEATLHIFNRIVSDDSFGKTTQKEKKATAVSSSENVNVFRVENSSTKKLFRKGKLFLIGLIMLIIGVLGVALSARYISGGFGLSYVFTAANFSNYIFDGLGILGLMGLIIIILVIQSAIRSLRN